MLHDPDLEANVRRMAEKLETTTTAFTEAILRQQEKGPQLRLRARQMKGNQMTDNQMTDNSVQRFDFRGMPVRSLVDSHGEPWFVAKDVCDVLGTRTKDLRSILESDEISNIDNIDIAQNGGRMPLIVSEPGLYRLIMRSRKPIAKEFQRWVTHEVLPRIRRTGGYLPTTQGETDDETMARAVLIAQRTIADQRERLAQAESRAAELEPKARFADAVAASDGTCLVGELAKMLRQNGMDIGQTRLFRLLREDGYLGKSGGNRNVPTQKAMELGLFRIKETAITHSDGHTSISRTPKVTGKGQTYFIDRYLDCRPLEIGGMS